MKVIVKVVDLIGEELCDAKRYIKLAERYRSEHGSLSECFATLSEAEMGHVRKLHDEVEKLIAEVRERDGEPPAEMLAVYNYEHKKQIEKATKIRRMIEEYRNE